MGTHGAAALFVRGGDSRCCPIRTRTGAALPVPDQATASYGYRVEGPWQMRAKSVKARPAAPIWVRPAG